MTLSRRLLMPRPFANISCASRFGKDSALCFTLFSVGPMLAVASTHSTMSTAYWRFVPTAFWFWFIGKSLTRVLVVTGHVDAQPGRGRPPGGEVEADALTRCRRGDRRRFAGGQDVGCRTMLCHGRDVRPGARIGRRQGPEQVAETPEDAGVPVQAYSVEHRGRGGLVRGAVPGRSAEQVRMDEQSQREHVDRLCEGLPPAPVSHVAQPFRCPVQGVAADRVLRRRL